MVVDEILLTCRLGPPPPPSLLTSARNIRLVQFIMPMAVLYNTAFQQGMEERRLYLEVEGCMGVTHGGEGLLFTAGHSCCGVP